MGETYAALCALGVAYIVGVGHGRWKLARWESRMRRWADAVVSRHEGAGS